MSDLRDEFERAYKSAAELGCFAPDLRLLKNGDYMQPSVYWAFWAWQASRAALKIELSCVNDTDSAPMLRYYIAEQLTDAGINYE
jgi:hypothetical protein